MHSLLQYCCKMNGVIIDFDQRLFLDILFSCAENVPLAVLLLFCSEGDNIPDAFTLVNHLNDWLHLIDIPVRGKLGQLELQSLLSFRLLHNFFGISDS